MFEADRQLRDGMEDDGANVCGCYSLRGCLWVGEHQTRLLSPGLMALWSVTERAWLPAVPAPTLTHTHIRLPSKQEYKKSNTHTFTFVMTEPLVTAAAAPDYLHLAPLAVPSGHPYSQTRSLQTVSIAAEPQTPEPQHYGSSAVVCAWDSC